MSRLIDLTGQRFGRLTVVRRGPNGGTQTRWYCQCDCGKMTLAQAGNLKAWAKRGVAISCGCLNAARVREMNYRHGGRYTSEYAAWKAAKERCTNPKHPAWKNYGGRGIRMCVEWLSSFEAFFKVIGPKPESAYELDRIDNRRGYEPGNVHWTTRSKNILNRRKFRVNPDRTRTFYED